MSTPLEPITKAREADLVLAAKHGSEEALAELLAQFRPAISDGVRRFTVGFSNPHTEQDLESEARFALLDAVRKWDASRNYRFGTLLRLSVRRRVVDYIRKVSRHDNRVTYSPDAQPEEGQYEVDFASRERFRQLTAQMEKLSPAVRQAITLRFVDQLSLPEILQKIPGQWTGTRALSRDISTAVKALREGELQ